MRTKTKTFFEDLLVLCVIGVIIYVAYSFIFGEDETNVISENKQVVEKSIENINFSKQVEEIKEELEKKVEETIANTQNEIAVQLEQKPVEDSIKPEVTQERVANKPEQEIVKIVEEKTEEKPISNEIEKKEIIEEIKEKPVVEQKIEKQPEQINDEKTRIEAFYKTIREKIDSNIDKSSFKTGEYVNIRVTILKDGRYEQLTFMEGNKEYFELIKPSIYKSFPVEIDASMKNYFPRYFRMKIEF